MKARAQHWSLIVLLCICSLTTAESCRHGHSDYRVVHQLVIDGNVPALTADLQRNPSDVNLKDDAGQTPLHLAAIHCRTNVITLLIERGGSVNAQMKGGATPLHLAAQTGCVSGMAILLAHGANVNARDNERRTPLRRAEEWQADASVEFLKQHGGKE